MHRKFSVKCLSFACIFMASGASAQATSPTSNASTTEQEILQRYNSQLKPEAPVQKPAAKKAAPATPKTTTPAKATPATIQSNKPASAPTAIVAPNTAAIKASSPKMLKVDKAQVEANYAKLSAGLERRIPDMHDAPLPQDISQMSAYIGIVAANVGDSTKEFDDKAFAQAAKAMQGIDASQVVNQAKLMRSREQEFIVLREIYKVGGQENFIALIEDHKLGGKKAGATLTNFRNAVASREVNASSEAERKSYQQMLSLVDASLKNRVADKVVGAALAPLTFNGKFTRGIDASVVAQMFAPYDEQELDFSTPQGANIVR